MFAVMKDDRPTARSRIGITSAVGVNGDFLHPLSIEERKQTFELGLVRLASVFANLKRFHILNSGHAVGGIPVCQFGPAPLGDALLPLAKSFANRFFPFGLTGRIGGIQIGGT